MERGDRRGAKSAEILWSRTPEFFASSAPLRPLRYFQGVTYFATCCTMRSMLQV
jgi:hypothetical protein